MSINLIKAARTNNIADAEAALARGADINFRDENGDTALALAAYEGHENMVEFLLGKDHIKVNPSPTSGCYKGYTPLRWASGQRGLKVVELLVKQDDVDINALAEDGTTPLLAAVRYGMVGNVKLLVDNGADINQKGENIRAWRDVIKKAEAAGVNPANLAEVSAYLKKKEEEGLLEYYADVIQCSTGDGVCSDISRLIASFTVDDVLSTEQFIRDNKKTPEFQFHEAIGKGIIADADCALSMGADINFRSADMGVTALLLTASRGHEGMVQMVQFLLRRDDIDVNLSITSGPNKGCTALTVAILKGHPNAVKLLLERDDVKKRIDTIAGYGMTPLSLALRTGKMDFVKWLVNKGANIYLQIGKDKLTWRNVLKQAKVEGVKPAKLIEISQYLIKKEGKDTIELLEQISRIGDETCEITDYLLKLGPSFLKAKKEVLENQGKMKPCILYNLCEFYFDRQQGSRGEYFNRFLSFFGGYSRTVELKAIKSAMQVISGEVKSIDPFHIRVMQQGRSKERVWNLIKEWMPQQSMASENDEHQITYVTNSMASNGV